MGALSDNILEHLRDKGQATEVALRNAMCNGKIHPDALGIILNKLRLEGKVMRSPQGVYSVQEAAAPSALERGMLPASDIEQPKRRCIKCGNARPIGQFRLNRNSQVKRIKVCDECGREAGHNGAMKAQETKQMYANDPGSVLVALPPEDDEDDDVPHIPSTSSPAPPDTNEGPPETIVLGQSLRMEPPHVPIDLTGSEVIHLVLEEQGEFLDGAGIDIEFLLVVVDIDANTHRIQMNGQQLRALYENLRALIKGESFL